jgi:hypothetical protein
VKICVTIVGNTIFRAKTIVTIVGNTIFRSKPCLTSSNNTLAHMQKIVLLLTLLLLAAAPEAFAQNKPRLTLTIIPTDYASPIPKDPSIKLSVPADHFHVLLTNDSAEPVNLFEEWNSWGYWGLSFEIIYPNGQKVKAVKTDKEWNKNFPSTVTIAPHGFYLFEVTMNTNPKNGDVWKNSVLNYKSKSNRAWISCRMRAIYSIESSEDAIKEKAWTGAISSPEGSYTIWP